MDQSLATLIEKIEAKFRQRMRDAELERDADIAAIRRVSELISENGDTPINNNGVALVQDFAQVENDPTDAPDDTLDVRDVREYGSIARQVRAAVDAIIEQRKSYPMMGQGFEVNDVIGKCQSLFKEVPKSTTVSSVLHRLEKSGVIVCTSKGAGKRASQYSAVKNTDDTDQED